MLVLAAPSCYNVLTLNDCLEVTEEAQSVRPDLTDVPLGEVKEVLYMNGSGFAQDEIKCAKVTVVTLGKMVWTQTLN